MKKQLLLISALFITSILSAQWVQVTNGLGDAPPTSMFPWLDTVYVGTLGDGIFRTVDNGENWIDISGDLASKNVNGIFFGPSSDVIFVATDNGPYGTQDLAHYIDCSGSGLTTTNINYYWFGGDDNTSWAIGSFGGGVFASSEFNGPWVTYNNGISGGGLYVKDMGGYTDETIEYAVIGTNNGMYFSTDNFATWVEGNNGLSGGALMVNDLTGLSSLILAATNAGLYMTYDNGANWTNLVPDDILTTVFFVESDLSSTGFYCYAFGESGYYSEDFKTFMPVDMGTVPGIVTAATATSTDVYIGVTVEEKDGKESGGMYRAPISEIVGIDEQNIVSQQAFLRQNYPNPCIGSTEINYTLKENAYVNIKLYNSLGQEIRSFVNEQKTQGDHTLRINVSDINEKVLYYSLYVDQKLINSRKMVIL